jgi:hypothetical protein
VPPAERARVEQIIKLCPEAKPIQLIMGNQSRESIAINELAFRNRNSIGCLAKHLRGDNKAALDVFQIKRTYPGLIQDYVLEEDTGYVILCNDEMKQMISNSEFPIYMDMIEGFVDCGQKIGQLPILCISIYDYIQEMHVPVLLALLFCKKASHIALVID